MQRSLLDIALLLLLVLFFGVQQRRHRALHFRLWLFGWIFGLACFAAVLLPLFPGEPATLRGLVAWDLALLGSITFAMSFLSAEGGLRRSLLQILAVAALLSGPVDLLLFDNTPSLAQRWLCVVMVLLGHALIGLLVWRELPADHRGHRGHRGHRWWRIAVAMLCAAAGLAYAYEFLLHPTRELADWIAMETYLCAAIAYAIYTNRSGRRFFGGIGVFGFVAWAAYCIPGVTLSSRSPVAHALALGWSLPKYLVAFSMILLAFEATERQKDELMDATHQLYDATHRLYEDFRMLYESHPHPTWICDAAGGGILSANDAAVEVYGYTQSELLTMRLIDLEAPPDAERAALEQFLPAPPDTIRIRHRYKDGRLAWVNLVDREIDFQGRSARLVMARDVTDRLKVNLELAHRAHHDTLTGLPNRELLAGRMEHALDTCRRDRRKAALLTIDIDHFKRINDTHGHLIGDACLQTVAARLQSKIRQVDTLARVGGEEFVAMIGNLHGTLRNADDDARTVAAALLRLFDDPLLLPECTVPLSISIGVAVFPDDGEDIDTLRRRSDEALYEAKRRGRNCAVLASEMS